MASETCRSVLIILMPERSHLNYQQCCRRAHEDVTVRDTILFPPSVRLGCPCSQVVLDLLRTPTNFTKKTCTIQHPYLHCNLEFDSFHIKLLSI